MGVEAKVCGLTRPGDAAVAVEAGASYLGVVFAGGPRVVTVAVASEIVAAASGCPVFGVFGRHSAEEILRCRDAAGLAGAQLHGAFDHRLAARLRANGLAVWAVARLTAPDECGGLTDLAAGSDAVLVEPRVAGAEGGAGVPLALDLGRRARAALRGQRMVLAGGLRPESVAAAIDAVGPDVVDVSSGVEMSPGRKDPAAVRLFLEAVRGDQPFP
ncbi:MAG: phosphoribosylanthranilate isomerase [Gemmatimonadales bacterium]